MSHLQHFKGVLQFDGYAGFEQLTAKGDIVLAACWAHTRRKFYEVGEATGSPLAAEALRRIGELYAIDAEVRGQSPPHRLVARRNRSKAVVVAFHAWLEAQLPHIPGRSTLAEAIRYALSRWPGLTRLLHEGRIELDTNPVERAIRPVALGRKNHLFAGSDGGGDRWAIVCSLAEPPRSTASNPSPISSTCFSEWLMDILSTVSTNCCPGPGKRQILSRADVMCSPRTDTANPVVSSNPPHSTRNSAMPRNVSS